MWLLNGYRVLFLGNKNILQLDMCMYIVNVLNATDLSALKRLILSYVNFLWMKNWNAKKKNEALKELGNALAWFILLDRESCSILSGILFCNKFMYDLNPQGLEAKTLFKC